jgi:magnesium chelatase family protein
VQAERYADAGMQALLNSAAVNSVIEKAAAPEPSAADLLRQAAEAMRFSARAYHRILKVARTIADLDGCMTVGRVHVAEAIAYRMPADRMAVPA